MDIFEFPVVESLSEQHSFSNSNNGHPPLVRSRTHSGSAPDLLFFFSTSNADRSSPPMAIDVNSYATNSTFTSKPQNRTDILALVVLWVCRTYPILLLTLGTAGNALNLVVMGRTCPHTSIGTLLRAIAIGNLVPLYFYILPLWIEKTFGYNVKSSSIPVCKLIPYALNQRVYTLIFKCYLVLKL